MSLERLRLFIRAGAGGMGNAALGSRGGNGGNVFLQAEEDVTFDKIRDENPVQRFNADPGLMANERLGRAGSNGSDLIIPVPPGVTVYKGVGKKPLFSDKRVKLGDLKTPGQRLLVARGGLGGMMKNDFSGTSGQMHCIFLDSRLSSDFSLIGFANAGKSSLINALTGSVATVSEAQFTTKEPLLASFTAPNGRVIKLVDLPGLDDVYAGIPPDRIIKKGFPELRSTKHLKHIVGSSLGLLLIDVNGFKQQYYKRLRNPLASAYLAMQLLERWSDGFIFDMPFVCVLNKIDTKDGEEIAERTMDSLRRWDSEEIRVLSGVPKILLPSRVPKFEDFHLISATQAIGIEQLKTNLPKYVERFENCNEMETCDEDEDDSDEMDA